MTKALQLPGKGRINGKKRIPLIAAGAVLGIGFIAFLISLLLRVDLEGARQTALNAVGGGQIVGQSVDREGFWSEYSFQIAHDNARYEVEVASFGNLTELESDWDTHWEWGDWD